jgi:sugar diacid utilization regulator
VAVLEHGSALVVPFDDGDTVAFAVFLRHDGARWDMRLAESLAVQAGLALQKVGMHERERRSRLQYQRLSELATGLTTARDVAAVRERLLEDTPGVLFADACFIALLDQGPDAITVELRDGPEAADRMIRLQGGARLASVRLRGEPEPDRSVFDTWSQEVFRIVGAERGLTTWMAEPLPLPVGSLGGLFVAWRSPPAGPSPEQRRILGMVAGAAGTTLARFAAHLATDSTLRDRLLELEALTRLAQRTSGLAHRRAIVDELLAAVRRVGVDGAAYGSVHADGVRIDRASGLDAEGIAAMARRLEALDTLRERRRVRADASGPAITVIPIAVPGEGDAFLAGTTSGEQDEQRDRVIATLARYAAVALENAELHDRQRDAISRLERQHAETAGQYDRLERILAIHDTLALAVLEGRGLDSVVRSLGEFLGAEMLVLAEHGRTLAEWPPQPGIGWRPRLGPGQPPRTIVERDGDLHVVAAPAVLDGRVQAWIIARAAAAPGDVERAAMEYAALLASLELLRERTALEVEARLRAGLLEELFDPSGPEDLVIERAHAFGYDLRQPSRVFLAEAASADGAPGDLEALHGLALECAERWASQNLVALNGNAAVIVVPELPSDEDAQRRFEDELRDAADAALGAGAANIAVGSSCRRVGDYRDSHLAARRGLDLLRVLGRPGETFSFREDTLESVLLQSTRVDVVVRFIERFVAPLDAYDREHTSDLRRTLEVFYDAGGTLEQAARGLHVHVSTLRYRLKKASELLGVDVKAGPAALDVQVALKAARVLAARRA